MAHVCYFVGSITMTGVSTATTKFSGDLAWRLPLIVQFIVRVSLHLDQELRQTNLPNLSSCSRLPSLSSAFSCQATALDGS